MDLILVPNDPLNTVLLSANGTPHYYIRTAKVENGTSPLISVVLRGRNRGKGKGRAKGRDNTDSSALVAEVEWRSWDDPTVVRSPLLKATLGVGLPSSSFLWKRHPFSRSHYFSDDDGTQYRWKVIRGTGYVLTCPKTNNAEIARFVYAASHVDSLFAGEKRHILRIQPGPFNIDIDLVILTFIILESKRRDEKTAGGILKLGDHDEEAAGDGGGEGE